MDINGTDCAIQTLMGVDFRLYLKVLEVNLTVRSKLHTQQNNIKLIYHNIL